MSAIAIPYQTRREAQRRAGRKVVMSPAAMRERSLALNKAIALERSQSGAGSLPGSFAEQSRAPQPSRKGSCRRRRGVK